MTHLMHLCLGVGDVTSSEAIDLNCESFAEHRGIVSTGIMNNALHHLCRKQSFKLLPHVPARLGVDWLGRSSLRDLRSKAGVRDYWLALQ